MHEQSYKYWAFISYSHADRRWAHWLHRALERYRVPRRLVRDGGQPARLRPIFLDQDELASAPELGHEIESALRQSRNLIVVCSPAAAASRWVNEEIRHFRALGHHDRIFCLIVDGDPNDLGRDCFAPALRQFVDGGGQPQDRQIEPIAADVRPGAGGRQVALLRIVAGLLSVGFDELRQRELVERNRRLSLFAGVASVIAIALAGLSFLAVQAQRTAEVARQDAERRLRQSELMEDLITQMFRDAGEQAGNTTLTARELLDASVERARQDFLADPATAARLLQQIGTLYFYLNDYPAAMTLLQEALNIPEASAPVRSAAAHDLAQMQLRTGEFEAAADSYRLAKDIWLSDSRRFEDDLLQGIMVEAQMARQKGDVGQAIKLLEQSLPRRLEMSGPSGRQSAVLMANLSVAYLYGGRTEEARAMSLRAWRAFQASRTSSNTNALTTLNNLATLSLLSGRLPEAEEFFVEAVARHRELLPASATTASLLNNYAKYHLITGQLDEAAALVAEARAMAEQFTGTRSPLSWSCLQQQAQIALHLGRHEQAGPQLQQACQLASDVYGPQHRRTARCLVLQALTLEGPATRWSQLDSAMALLSSQPEARLELGDALWHRALLHLSEGSLDAARQDLQQLLELQTESFAEQHFEPGRTAAVLGAVEIAGGQAKRGRATLAQGLQRLDQLLGPEHSISRAVRGMADDIQAGRYREAVYFVR